MIDDNDEKAKFVGNQETSDTKISARSLKCSLEFVISEQDEIKRESGKKSMVEKIYDRRTLYWA